MEAWIAAEGKPGLELKTVTDDDDGDDNDEHEERGDDHDDEDDNDNNDATRTTITMSMTVIMTATMR